MFSMPQNTKLREATRPPCTNLPFAVFFPPTDSSHAGKPNKAELKALSVCARCPLAARTRCLQDALSYPIDQQYGVVGWTTAAQRKAILRGRQAAQIAGVAA